MPESKITPAVARTIRAAKKRGDAHTVIVDEVRKKHRVRLDRRTIDRWVEANPPRPPKKPPAPVAESEPKASSAAKAAEEEVDEVARLIKREAALLQRLEDAPEMGALSLAALNREYRQTLAAIRVAKAARSARVSVENADAKWLLTKLRRWDAMNRPAPPAEPDGLPEATRAANS